MKIKFIVIYFKLYIKREFINSDSLITIYDNNFMNYYLLYVLYWEKVDYNVTYIKSKLNLR